MGRMSLNPLSLPCGLCDCCGDGEGKRGCGGNKASITIS